jgi:hypothetical protein
LKLHPEWQPSLGFEYVKDIVEDDAFNAVFKKHHDQFDYIVHTASPVAFTVDDIQKDLIDPAVKGYAAVEPLVFPLSNVKIASKTS